MNPTSINRVETNGSKNALTLDLVVADQAVVAYLAKFEDEQAQCQKALEALKVGVIAIQSASPSLDTQVVQSKFSEVERSMKEQLAAFQSAVQQELCRYFKEKEGAVPRSIDNVFGENGSLVRTFHSFFDPNDGRVCHLMQTQIGPQSVFGKALNPDNKQGVIALIEARIQELVEAKLNEVLKQFSLDEDESAMSRLNTMLTEFFAKLNSSLGVQTGAAAEAEKGHVKGLEFEKDLYSSFAKMGRELGDHTELVRGIVGAVSRSKKGDYVAALGDSSGAPGAKVVVEVKDQALKLKDAIDELQTAKTNREATVGILVFSRGCEPPEVGDFRKIGEDFFCTVDKGDLLTGKSLLYFESAYKIARASIVFTSRKESVGELDIQKIQDHLDALAAWSDRIADIATKARTIQKSGRLIEECASDLKDEMDKRIDDMLALLRGAAVE